MAVSDGVVSIAIGGTIGASLEHSITTAKKAINGLGQQLSEAAKQGKLADNLQNLRQTSKQAASALVETRDRVTRLRREFEQTAKPSRALARSLKSAEKAASRATREFVEQSNKLRRLGKAATEAGIDVADLAREQDRLARSTDRLARKRARLERLQSRRDNLISDRQGLQGELAQSAGVGIGVAAGITPSVLFESALADVGRVGDFADAGALKAFGEQLRELSLEIPTLPRALAAIAAEGARLGLPTDELLSFTRLVSEAATAFGLIESEAADALAKLSNIFDIPIAKVRLLADAINELGNSSAASETEILDILKRVGASARIFGLSATQAAALGTALVSLGRTPEVAATGINALLSRLQAAESQSQKFKDALNGLGLSAVELADAIEKDPQRALREFLGLLSELDNRDLSNTLVQLFGREYSDDLATLIKGLDEYDKALASVGDQSRFAGGLAEEFNKRLTTTLAQLKLLRNGALNLAIAVGDTVLPTIKTLSRIIGDLLGDLAGLVERFPRATGAIVQFVAAIAVGRLGLKALGFGLNLLKGFLLAVKTRLALAATAIGGLGGASAAAAPKVSLLARATKILGAALRSLTVLGAILSVLYLLKDEFPIIEELFISLKQQLFSFGRRVEGFFERMAARIDFLLQSPIAALRQAAADLFTFIADTIETLPGGVVFDFLGLDAGFRKAASLLKPAGDAAAAFRARIAAINKDVEADIKAITDKYFALFRAVRKGKEGAAGAGGDGQNEEDEEGGGASPFFGGAGGTPETPGGAGGTGTDEGRRARIDEINRLIAAEQRKRRSDQQLIITLRERVRLEQLSERAQAQAAATANLSAQASANTRREVAALAGKLFDIQAAASQAGGALNQFAVQAARNIQSSFADFLFAPFEEGLKGMVRGFADTLRRIASEIIANRALSAVFGALAGSGFGPLASFGQAALGAIQGRASGGPVYAGRPYVVGEEGPELLVPASAGTVVPNARTGGTVVQVINNTSERARVESGTAPDGRQLKRVVIGTLQDDLGRNGPYSRDLQRAFGLRLAGASRG